MLHTSPITHIENEGSKKIICHVLRIVGDRHDHGYDNVIFIDRTRANVRLRRRQRHRDSVGSVPVL